MLSAKGFEMEHMCLRALCFFFEVVGLTISWIIQFLWIEELDPALFQCVD